MKKEFCCDCHHKTCGLMTSYPNEEIMEKMASVLKIAADATRLKILYALLQGPKCVCDIQDLIGASQSLVSHQLKVLRDNNLVRCEKQGNKALYTLSDNHVVALLSIVHEHVMEGEE